MRRAAACWATVLPVAVLPVNIRKSTASMSGCPSVAPRPVTTCAKPMGSPASSSRPTAQRAEYGVCASGLMIDAVAGHQGRQRVGDAQRERIVPGRDEARPDPLGGGTPTPW